MKTGLMALLCLLLVLVCPACQAVGPIESADATITAAPLETTPTTVEVTTGESRSQTMPGDGSQPETTVTADPLPTPEPSPVPTDPSPRPSPTARPTQKPTPTAKPTPRPTAGPLDPDRLAGHLVVLDPGHQAQGNFELEPIAPGSTEMKIKTSTGTSGVATHRAEYIVNLEISLMLAEYLEAQGCTVHLTRTTHDVDLSNIDRAEFAKALNPDAYLRIHCNGSASQSAAGVEIYVPDSGTCRESAFLWGGWLAAELCESTGAKNRGVISSGLYTGLNWAADIPSFLVEMGYMTNPEEDRRLSDPQYQMALCEGFADFIERLPVRCTG